MALGSLGQMITLLTTGAGLLAFGLWVVVKTWRLPGGG